MANSHSKINKKNRDGAGFPRLPPFGIAMGRGGRANNHGGNDAFRDLVAAHKMDYIQKGLPRCQKIAIKKHVVEEISKEGMIFMEKKGDLWYRVTCAKRINLKVSQALRERAPQIREEIIEGTWSVGSDRLTEDVPSTNLPDLVSSVVVGSDTTVVSVVSNPSSPDDYDDHDSNQSVDESIAWGGEDIQLLDDSIDGLDMALPVWLEDIPLVEHLSSGVFSI